jgi:hypothetical protein
MAVKPRQRRRTLPSKPTVGILPKELWIIKPLIVVLGVVLLINVKLLSSLESLNGGVPNGLKINMKAQRTPQNRVEQSPQPFRFNRQQAEVILATQGAAKLREHAQITAYLEPPMQDIVLGTVNQGDPTNATDVGTPPRFVEPLPTRTHKPSDLKKVVYPKFQTCHDLPSKLPVDRGLILDDDGNVIVWNTPTEPNPSYDDSPHCPVDEDPHLPWIHDMVPTHDRIRFVAQNRRRCSTGTHFTKQIQHLTPQVSLFQSVSIQEISSDQATNLAPELYQDSTIPEPRYRLADFNQADYNHTRFRCIFTATNLTSGHPQVVGETLSVYPFNYEFVSWRRSIPTMLNPRGTDKANIYTATLLFDCPVPTQLQPLVASGNSILSDGTPTLHLDLVPIRTSPRYGLDQVHFSEEMAGPKETWNSGTFNRTLWRNPGDPLHGFNVAKQWGSRHVLPLAAASGRWTNLPICQPVGASIAVEDDDEAAAVVATDEREEAKQDMTQSKPHHLVACVWASASYATRGMNVAPTTSSLDRINEWLEFALLVGFDHVYVYDNSAANHPTLNLQGVTDRFAAESVTRIQWDHSVCNNNQPKGVNPGERSSQYAAENSCRVRFGPLTEWMASFDLDEYLIPMGSYDSLKQVTHDAAAKGHSILDFRSTRTKLRLDASEAVPNAANKKDAAHTKKATVPFLQAYNCDTEPPPKPPSGDRARKEIYRPDYVLYHFVHYSLVSTSVASFYNGTSSWVRRDTELQVPEHQTNEITEAVMLHAKSAKEAGHSGWQSQCKIRKKYKGCVIGIPWPRTIANWTGQEGEAKGTDNYLYNCHENIKLVDYWLPKLAKAMKDRAIANV